MPTVALTDDECCLLSALLAHYSLDLAGHLKRPDGLTAEGRTRYERDLNQAEVLSDKIHRRREAA